MGNLVNKKQAVIIFVIYTFIYTLAGFMFKLDKPSDFTVIAIIFLIGSVISVAFLYMSYRRVAGKGRYFWLIMLWSMVTQVLACASWSVSMYISKAVSSLLIASLYSLSLLLYFSAIIYKVYEKKSDYRVGEIMYDSGIIVAVAYTLCYIFVVGPVVKMGWSINIIAVYLAFPIMEIVLIVGLVSLLLSNKPVLPRKVLSLNLIGIILYAFANVAYFYSLTRGGTSPSFVYLLWAVGPMLISISGFFDDEDPTHLKLGEMTKFYSIGRIVSPYIALIILFVIGIFKSDQLAVISIGYMIVVVIITVRQAAVLIDNRRLMLELKSLNTNLENKVEERTQALDMKSRDFEYQANHDSLTGLPNRRAFALEFRRAIEEAGDKKQVALLYLDLDSFKNINDLLGHNAGDTLLIEVSRRISGCLGEKHRIYRLGGDEFSVVIEDVSGPDHINSCAEKIHDALREEIVIKDNRLNITSSIGIAVYPHDGDTVDSLMKSSDIAMYSSKGKGRGSSEFFSTALHEYTFKRMNIGKELNRALKNNEFTVFYQPQYDTRVGRIYGMEALIRWNSPSLGMVSPGDFIPLAEETGHIVPIGEWVLREACIQARKWNNLAGRPIKIGVNISPRQFQQEDFIDMIRRTLMETGLEPELLDLEITEYIPINNEKNAIRKLKDIRALGVSISMDDFGTGYSSLRYLKELPVDTMKIAMPFVKAIQRDQRDRAIVDSIISIAKSLGINVIAEGVETFEQLKLLGELGCSNVQGYLIGRPVPSEEFELKYLSDENSPEASVAATTE